MKIQEQLKEARLGLGWSQEETARRCGMSLNNYARIERGNNSTTITTLEAICEVLELRVELVPKRGKTAQKVAHCGAEQRQETENQVLLKSN